MVTAMRMAMSRRGRGAKPRSSERTGTYIRATEPIANRKRADRSKLDGLAPCQKKPSLRTERMTKSWVRLKNTKRLVRVRSVAAVPTKMK